MRRWMQVAHTYNPSYSGGRDQKDQGSKPALAKKKKKKITQKKRAGGVAQGVGPEFKSQYWKKNNNNKDEKTKV
jgi:hypothetical protein